MNYLKDFHSQNRRFMSGFTADDRGCISLVKSRMQESCTSGSVRGCSCERGQSTRPAMRDGIKSLQTDRQTDKGVVCLFLHIVNKTLGEPYG